MNPIIPNTMNTVSIPNFPLFTCAITGFFFNSLLYSRILLSVSLNISACLYAGFYKLLSNPDSLKLLFISLSKYFFVWSVGAACFGRRYFYNNYDNGIDWIFLSYLLIIFRRNWRECCNYYWIIFIYSYFSISFWPLDIFYLMIFLVLFPYLALFIL